jgi:hypothetical protein
VPVDNVTLQKDGNAVSVPIDQAADLIQQGYSAESPEQRVARISSEQFAERDPGLATSITMGALRGATLGGSDVVARALGGTEASRQLKEIKEEHPIGSDVGQVAGAIVPALFGGSPEVGESLFAATPAGIVSNIGSKIAAIGGESALGKIGATAAAGAFEGAAQNTGSYISDVALGDRDATADGFMGAMGKGALWGGVAGGALSAASRGIIAARRLLPEVEFTPEAAAVAESKASNAIRNSVEDSRQLERIGQEELAKARYANEPMEAAAAQAEAAGAAGTQRLARRAAQAQAEEEAVALGTKDIPAEALLANRFRTLDEPRPVWESGDVRENILSGQALKQPKAPSPGAMDALRQSMGARATAPVATEEGGDLLAQLAGTKAAIDSGKSLQEIATAARQPVERLENALQELKSSRGDLLQSMAKTVPEPPPRTLAEAILQGPASSESPDEAIAKALGKSEDVTADIQNLAPKVTRYEAARAEVSEALGSKAPAEAQEHAAAFRQAQQEAENASAKQVAQSSESINAARAGVPVEKTPGGQSILKKAAGKVSGVAQAWEAARMAGLPLPSLSHIPVVGPILSLIAKAKLVKRLAGRIGGRVAETAETTIAAKSAETYNRINAAVKQMLETTSTKVQKIAEVAGGPAAALAHPLFESPDGKKLYTSSPKVTDLNQMYLARMDELSRAMKPGAIETAVRARIGASDPRIVDSIVASQQRIAQTAYAMAPKTDPNLLPGQPPKTPSKTEITNWGMALAALHDPAAVFEKLAKGGTARPEEMVAVQSGFPKLFAQAQMQLVHEMSEMTSAPSYAMRAAISAAFGLPLDQTFVPVHAAALQQGYARPAQMPQAPMATPTLKANISLGEQSLTRLDH